MMAGLGLLEHGKRRGKGSLKATAKDTKIADELLRHMKAVARKQPTLLTSEERDKILQQKPQDWGGEMHFR